MAAVHASTFARQAFTRQVKLCLATPRALSQGLALLGLDWAPSTHVSGSTDRSSGLYCWVAPAGGDHLNSGVIYIGVGTGRGKGWNGRVAGEATWKPTEAGAQHGHGLAINRLDAAAVGGPVSRNGASETEILDLLDPTSHGRPVLESLVEKISTAPDPTAIAEVIAIRLAIHLGDTGAPVNSRGATAWATDSEADWAAWAAARRMCGETTATGSVPTQPGHAQRDRPTAVDQ